MLGRFYGLFVCFLSLLEATDIPIGNDKDLTRFLQDHAKQHEERIDENLERPFLPYEEVYKPSPPPAKEDNLTETCLPIHTIIVNGATELADAELEVIIAPFRGQCLTVSMIEDMLRRITAAYHAKGLVTSRASLKVPQESTKDGILEIVVTEGWIEKILFNQDTFRDRLQSKIVLGHLVGENLNIRDIDHAIEQINRLSSQNATMQIEPGSTTGASIIAVKTQPEDTIQVSLSYRDEGRKLEDKATWTPAVLIENPLALNDQLRASYSQKEDDGSKKYERSESASYTFPYALWLFDLSYSKSKYLSTIHGSNASFESSGFVKTTTLNANRLLFRNQKQKTTFDLYIEQRENKSYINETLVGVSSHKVSNAKLAINHLHYIEDGVFSLTFGTKRGVEWFDADDEKEDIQKNEPHTRFQLYNLYISLNKNLNIWRLSADLSFQHPEHELLSSEQFSTVKGISEDGGRSLTLKAGTGLTSLLKHPWSQPFYMDAGYTVGRVESASSDGYADTASVYSASLQFSQKYYSCRASVEFGGQYPSHGGYTKDDYPHQTVSCSVNMMFM